MVVYGSCSGLERGAGPVKIKYISEVKPDAMGKIQPAHELAWFLCVMDSSGNQASTRLSEPGSGFRAICTHKFNGAVIVKLSEAVKLVI
uniref:Uncharacterized protein n=1 Tax=Magallana gigas TaxID=29159 RepID=K1PJ79_MAGGI